MNEHIEDLFSFYALDALSDEEKAQVEAYVAANPEAQARLEAAVQTASLLPYAAATPVAPAPETRQALMARVRADARAPERAQMRPSFLDRLRQAFMQTSPALAAVGLAVAIIVSVWALNLSQQLADQQTAVAMLNTRVATFESDAASMGLELEVLQEQNEALRLALQAQDEVLAMIAAPGARAQLIAGTEEQPGAAARLFAEPGSTSAVFVASGLTRLPDDRVYQLWLIRGELPISAGLFRVNERGQGFLSVSADSPVTGFDAVGVSVEPDGGSPQPTGSIVLLGEVSS